MTGATWREFHLDRRVSPTAVAILDTCRRPDSRDDDYIFSGDGEDAALSNEVMSAVLDPMGLAVTVHGFRSSFRTWVAEATDHPGELAEAALAHTNKNKVEAAYLRSKLFKRRAVLMADWDAFLSKPQEADVR